MSDKTRIKELVDRYYFLNPHSPYKTAKSYHKKTDKTVTEEVTISDSAWNVAQQVHEEKMKYKQSIGASPSNLDFMTRDKHWMKLQTMIIMDMKDSTANAVFELARAQLESQEHKLKGKDDEFITLLQTMPGMPDHHNKKMDWSLKVLFRLKILNLKQVGQYTQIDVNEVGELGLQKKIEGRQDANTF